MIVGAGGKLSGGKTVFCVSEIIKKHEKTGKKILSNIKLNHIPYTYMSNDAFIKILKNKYEDQEYLEKVFFRRILLLDEITSLLDARKSGSNLNVLITSFFMNVGKLDCDVYFTYQVLDSQVDVRVRNVCNMFANCYRIDSKGNLMVFKDRIVDEKVYIRVIIEIDLPGGQLKQGSFVLDPQPYFKYYSTREMTLLDRERYLAKKR